MCGFVIISKAFFFFEKELTTKSKLTGESNEIRRKVKPHIAETGFKLWKREEWSRKIVIRKIKESL